MKELSELNLPEDVRYAEDHEWARKQGDTVRVGISDYAQDQLGDVVFVELPGVGDKLAKGDAFGSVESVKAVSELFMPIGGEVSGINDKLADEPELVNGQPYGDGWMIEVKVADDGEFDQLMDKQTYTEMLKGL